MHTLTADDCSDCSDCSSAVEMSPQQPRKGWYGNQLANNLLLNSNCNTNLDFM